MISIYTGVAGLQASQRAVDVIANNIANVNTIGFKSSRVTFAEAIQQTLRGASESGVNPMQIGLGVNLGSIDNLMTQGNLKSTGNATDAAIMGDGFFMLGDGTKISYTRAGDFQLDGSNELVSASNGACVLGWAADPATGTVDTSGSITAASAILIPIGTRLAARQTANITYQGNLDSTQDTSTPVSTSFTVYDSLGNSHALTVQFARSATTDNAWTWTVSSPDGTSTDTGTLTFTSDGEAQTDSISFSLALTTPSGAAATIPMTADVSTLTQLAGSTSAQAVSQDGLAPGSLESFNIDESGIVTGVYSNGMSETLAQIAIAGFTNPAGLTKLGNGLYSPSANSGIPNVQAPGAGSNGTLSAGYLEMSNVDLAQEFADLIVMQRAFQANSKIVTTGDEMLQDVLSLKR